MEATRACRDTCERTFSAVMGMNVSINGHVSCLLMYEQFCSDAENNFHLFWGEMHVSLFICKNSEGIQDKIFFLFFCI